MPAARAAASATVALGLLDRAASAEQAWRGGSGGREAAGDRGDGVAAGAAHQRGSAWQWQLPARSERSTLSSCRARQSRMVVRPRTALLWEEPCGRLRS